MLNLNPRFCATVCSAVGARSVVSAEVIQSLWSGYGEILRVALDGGAVPSVIVKRIRFEEPKAHPRGWNSNDGHARKIRSYEVEMAWYQGWSGRCGPGCRVPKFLAGDRHENGFLIVLEDLDMVGYTKRLQRVYGAEVEVCLSWLACFHARFMGEPPERLWEVGTYWHLDTRKEELEALGDQRLKDGALKIDRILKNTRYQTLVHGDAKVANFCFSEDGGKVAAVDFQYVGGGCGVKDVAYFLGSCLDDESCEKEGGQFLDCYFEFLRKELKANRPSINPEAVEAEWRELFRFAWTDFYRFLKGWCPGHPKINAYSERLAVEVLETI